jgi:hypothetical protein
LGSDGEPIVAISTAIFLSRRCFLTEWRGVRQRASKANFSRCIRCAASVSLMRFASAAIWAAFISRLP